MSVLAKAAAVLDAGRLDVTTITDLGREPLAVAFARSRDRGSVMFLLRRSTGDWMAIIALMQRGDASWDEVTLVHKPWWDPVEAFERDELILTGGHSRFAIGTTRESVLVPGQAAPHTSVVCAHGDDVDVFSPWGHFIYLGEHECIGQPVTLTARRADTEQTAVFDPIDYP